MKVAVKFVILLNLVASVKLSENLKEEIAGKFSEFNVTHLDLENLNLEDAESLDDVLKMFELDEKKILELMEHPKTYFKEKCNNVTGTEGAFEDAFEAVNIFSECISKLIDVFTVIKEIEEAKPKAEIDVVAKKYCLKRESFTECRVNFRKSIDPCFTEHEHEKIDLFEVIFEKLMDFICYKNGAHIGLFVSEKGPECLKDELEGLKNCFTETYEYMQNADELNLQIDDGNFTTGPKECLTLHNLEYCILKPLDTCESSTPSNLAESLFRFVRREISCERFINLYKVKKDHNVVALKYVFFSIIVMIIAILTFFIFSYNLGGKRSLKKYSNVRNNENEA